MATIAGSTNYKIYLSTSYTGSAGSETPSGDVVYFWVEDYDRSFANLVKPKDLVGNSQYYPANKWTVNVTLKNIHVVAQQAATATAEANLIDDFIYTYSVKKAAAGMYLFLYHEADATYRKFNWTPTGTHSQTMKVVIDGYNDHPGQGKIIIYPSMKFLKAY